MTVAEVISLLENMPRDEEIFVRYLDSDEDPVFMRLIGVSCDPEGIMIQGGNEVEFSDDDSDA